MSQWATVCDLDDLAPDVGTCVLHQGNQIAIFSPANTERLYALSNFDPVANANVMSRGMIGSAGDDLYVASPIYKQRYKLEDGRCLDDDELSLRTFPVRIEAGDVEILIEGEVIDINKNGVAL